MPQSHHESTLPALQVQGQGWTLNGLRIGRGHGHSYLAMDGRDIQTQFMPWQIDIKIYRAVLYAGARFVSLVLNSILKSRVRASAARCQMPSWSLRINPAAS
jgi:hypothetical protein